MIISDYLKLVLDGLISNDKHLVNFIYRESKKAEELFIENHEFFSRLHDATDLLFNDINRQYFERLKELATIKSMMELNGESTDDLIDQKPDKHGFSVLLQAFTNGQYLGHLGYLDLVYFKKCLVKALNRQLYESKSNNLKPLKEVTTTVKPPNEVSKTLKVPTVINQLTKPIIALICYYNGTQITRENELEIANKYGHEHSGRLYLEYTAITSKADRLATDHLKTITKQRNRKDRYDLVISQLEGKPKQNAIDELNIILARMKNSNTL